MNPGYPPMIYMEHEPTYYSTWFCRVFLDWGNPDQVLFPTEVYSVFRKWMETENPGKPILPFSRFYEYVCMLFQLPLNPRLYVEMSRWKGIVLSPEIHSRLNAYKDPFDPPVLREPSPIKMLNLKAETSTFVSPRSGSVDPETSPTYDIWNNPISQKFPILDNSNVWGKIESEKTTTSVQITTTSIQNEKSNKSEKVSRFTKFISTKPFEGSSKDNIKQNRFSSLVSAKPFVSSN